MTQLPITTLCDRLQHPEWVQPLETIVRNYDAYPLSFPEDDPAKNIHCLLEEALQRGNMNCSQEGAFVQRVSALDIFCNQAFVRDYDNQKIIAWNPLEMAYTEFARQHAKHECLSVEDAYPPENHIRMWLYLQTRS